MTHIWHTKRTRHGVTGRGRLATEVLEAMGRLRAWWRAWSAWSEAHPALSFVVAWPFIFVGFAGAAQGFIWMLDRWPVETAWLVAAASFFWGINARVDAERRQRLLRLLTDEELRRLHERLQQQVAQQQQEYQQQRNRD